MCMSGENLAGVEAEVYNAEQARLSGLVLVRSNPQQGYTPLPTPASPLKRVFYWARFHLTGLGETCPAILHHSPTKLRAVEDKPQPHLSLKSITGAGRNAIRNDAELVYCVNDKLPDDATAPKGIRVESLKVLTGFGVFLPKFLHSPKGIYGT